MVYKCSIISQRYRTEKDVHLQPNPLPPLSAFVRIAAYAFPPKVQKLFMDTHI